MDKDGIIINIFGRIGRPESKRPFITIACAIPKQTKMEDIVDKITQLGADRLIPLITERVIVKLDQHKKDLKLSRWQKIAIQASEQSGRKTLPVISPVMTFTEALSETNGCRLKLIPTLEGRRKHIREIMRSETPGSVAAFIGPEGDFTPREVAAAQQHGFTPVSLGETVLRVDTATIALTTLLVSGLDIGQNSEK
jgi:16S rRNA (uracil1498-N3)-methyltransferase